jgi:hypothetical protein
LGVSVQNVTQLGGRVDFLRPFIWSPVSGLVGFDKRSNNGTASVHQILCTETKNGKTGEEQSLENAHHFL